MVDIGPLADHTETRNIDRRDLRDPAKVGIALKSALRAFPGISASELYDAEVHALKIPDIPHDSSLVQSTVATYRSKMQAQAAKGDLAAVRILLDKEWPLPDDLDPTLAERAREMSSADDEVIDE